MQSMSNSSTRVILLRHGASTFNVAGRYQGCSDQSLLTQEGKAAARLSGKRLRSEKIKIIISSPLKRAAETAREVRAVLEQSGDRVPFVTDARLREVDLKDWEGMAYDRVKREFPAQLSAWRLNPSDLRMSSDSEEDAFPVRSLYRRTESFWKDLVVAYANRSVLLVTHGGTARALVTSTLGLGIKHFQRVQLSNCGISCLTVRRPAGRTKLELLNDTSHLTTALPKLKEGRTGVRLLLMTANSSQSEDYLELSAALKGVAIDRMLVLNSVSSAALPVLDGHSAAERVSESWLERNLRRIIESAMAGQALSQVVVVARTSVGRRLLECCLDLPPGVGRSLALKRIGINAIHWPGNGVPPVLQAMNVFGRKKHLTGGHL